MDLRAIENDLIAKLIASAAASSLDFDGVRFKSIPENILIPGSELYDPKGGIFIRYNGSTWERPVANRNKTVTQKRNPQWTVFILYRSFFSTPSDPGHNKSDGSAGIYVWFDFVKETFLGYTPGTQSGTPENHSTIMSMVSDRVVDKEDGTWYYEMIWEHITPEVAV